jgi:hypothetical protein
MTELVKLTPEEIKQTRYKDTLGLIGRKIVSIRWMTASETKQFAYIGASPVVLKLDDGTCLIPQMDDEGNDGGALYVIPGEKNLDENGNVKKENVLYVQRW